LRFLQEREVRPLGSTAARKVDVRVVAASNRDLRKLVADGTFREDLWYRLQVTSLRLAPLRERHADIPLLVEHFLDLFRQRSGRSVRLSSEALDIAVRFSWPGNVRHLQNVLERLVILSGATLISKPMFTEALEALSPGTPDHSSSDSLSSREQEHIRRVLEATHGNKTRAAEILGIERKTLYRKLNRMHGESS
jgi:transcriptional regulator with PAS, ATPase and Fis domain